MKQSGQIKILFYNKLWNGDYLKYPNLRIPENFQILYGKIHLQMANVVIFHIPTLHENIADIKKERGQLWVFLSMECELHYQGFHKPEILGLFDIKATYKLDSDIPLPYYAGVDKTLWRKPPLEKTEFVNAFISSRFDLSNRIILLKELMSFLNIHSYGKIMNNTLLNIDKGPLTKEIIISKYKFTLSFENAIAEDYVTEKFFQPLIMGSVPIYLGAPNVDKFAPGDHCYINISSFSSAKELAEYLVILSNDENAYNKYLEWKELPFKSEFESKIISAKTEPLYKLFNKIIEML